MEKLYKILLVVGIIIALSSAYLMFVNSIYAVFSSVIGVLIIGFSVFEILSFKNMRERKKLLSPGKEKPIASKKTNDDLEWTYYGADKKKREEVREEPVEEKKSFFSKIFSRSKKPEEEKEEVKEVKIKKLKTKEEKESEKKKLILDYVRKSLKYNIPKDKIIESAVASDWPHDLVEDVIKEATKGKHKKSFVFVSVLAGISLCIFLFLVLSGNLLFGYWIETLSSGSIFVYLGVVVFLLLIIIVFVLRLKSVMKKKRKVYKAVEDKKVSEFKEIIKSGKGASFGVAYQTDIDKLLDLVNKKGKVSLGEVVKTFGVTKVEAENWGKILKDQELVTIYYPTVGDPELRCKKAVKKEEE